MIRDRGRIKWTSMMLPEHVKLLRDWAKEDTYEKRKELDEQELDRMNEVVAEAMEFGKWVSITHYVKHRHQLLIGTIHHVDSLEGKLHVVDRFEEVYYISLSNITDIRFFE
ncbi:YolD-like family protein [Rossellomorea sp. AcN35-11]|nr:YolD-like family protein [Rossellomorea aquimaris]NMH68732.1 YolD-like family protein [Bacillus sp. RO3]WJV28134.1 YolD-like family protein [Rossellomorea sp. AcN35-11]